MNKWSLGLIGASIGSVIDVLAMGSLTSHELGCAME